MTTPEDVAVARALAALLHLPAEPFAAALRRFADLLEASVPPDPQAVPYLAVGNSEPLPEGLPAELVAVLRGYRTKAGWCDHGRRLGACCRG